VGDGPVGIVFHGVNVWTANNSGSVSKRYSEWSGDFISLQGCAYAGLTSRTRLRHGSRRGRAQVVTDLQMFLTGSTILVNGPENTKVNPTLRRFVIADTSIGSIPGPTIKNKDTGWAGD